MTTNKTTFLAVVLLAACTEQDAVVRQVPGDELESSGKALVNAQGPDITVNQQRLAASIQVLANQTITREEIEDGCAVGGTTGRTLIRFDVETPNRGPGDLAVGQPSCKSTDARPACTNVDCNLAPDCCAQGHHVCTSSLGPQLGRGFEFNSAHRHIHFRSFANYRLLTQTGTVAAQGHKQSFCLMDMVDVTPGSCRHRFACGNQGISAGCADIYSASLPCGFVDVTGVQGGDYVLEVTMDPEDVINESNEQNNRVTVPVRVPQIGPVPDAGQPDAPTYLVRDGVGSAAEGTQYYRTLLGVGVDPNTYPLETWKAEFVGTRPTVKAMYRNQSELGFWREMTCTATLARGEGGCFVTNWTDFEDPQRGAANLGTVAMNVSPEGFTRFYVFGPSGVLQPFAILDDEGPKFVPQLCTTCHAGGTNAAGRPDLGSVFREFEPSQLQVRPGISAAEAQAEWSALNAAIRSANRALRTEAEGAPFGTNRARASLESYVTAMYGTSNPPTAIDVSDPAHVPASWKTGASGAALNARIQLWTKLTNVYCQTCHRLNSMDFSNYAQWQLLSSSTQGRALIRRYIEPNPADPQRRSLPFMPQSKVAHETLLNDAEALIALDNWLTTPVNAAPTVAITGGASSIGSGAPAALRAVATDADGDTVQLQWEVASGVPVSFSPNATAADVTFTAPTVTAPATLVIRVRASDGRGGTAEATTTFTITPAQNTGRLLLEASPSLTIPDNTPTGIVSRLATTDARVIEDLEATVEIDHTYIGDLTVTLVGPGFTRVLHGRTGREADNLRLTVNVTEARGLSAAGEYRLEVKDSAAVDTGTLKRWSLSLGLRDGMPGPGNTPPLANAGPDLTGSVGATVNLDGSLSRDPDGDALTYQWTQVSGTPVTLLNPRTPRVSLVAPSTAQTLELKLTVTDARGASASDTVRVAIQAATVSIGKLAIAEVMVNPVGIDGQREWVKLYNGSGATLDLSRFSLAFGGDPAYGTAGSSLGGVVQLSGTLPAGKCLLVGGPQSSPDNGNASFAPSATFGLKLARAFGGVGLQNPANDVPDAVALFDVPASLVRRDRSPVDILVYHSSSTAQLSSPFKGLGTAATARVNVITGFDLGAGKSIRRLGLDRWEISGRVGSAEGGLPTPNACTAVGR